MQEGRLHFQLVDHLVVNQQMKNLRTVHKPLIQFRNFLESMNDFLKKDICDEWETNLSSLVEHLTHFYFDGKQTYLPVNHSIYCTVLILLTLLEQLFFHWLVDYCCYVQIEISHSEAYFEHLYHTACKKKWNKFEKNCLNQY